MTSGAAILGQATVGAGPRRWRRVPRPSPAVADAVLALAITVLALATATVGSRSGSDSSFPVGPFPPGSPGLVVSPRPSTSPLLVALIALPLSWRRRWPIAVFLVQFAAVELRSGEVPTGTALVLFLAIMVGAYSAAAYSPHRTASLLILLGAAAAVAAAGQNAVPDIPGQLSALIILVPIWLAGNAIRVGRERAGALEDRAALLAQAQRAETRRAVDDERARIARELHDVVSHSVSVMVVQAGAGRQMLRHDPDRASEALLAVEASGREALTELRHLLGVLAPLPGEAGAGRTNGVGLPDPSGPLGPTGSADSTYPAGHGDPDDREDVLAPQPGLDQLPALVERLTDAGARVSVEMIGPRPPIPPGVELTAFRVVQEALTNSLKHARGALTHVAVEFGPADLLVEVRDDGRGPADAGLGAVTAREPGTGREPGPEREAGPGRGLIGLAERVSLFGGEFDAGRRPGGGYRVRARLPLESP